MPISSQDIAVITSVSLVRIGETFGLYKTLHERGPMTVAELPPQPGSISGTCANGYRIRRPRII
jgi:hypothetical protein